VLYWAILLRNPELADKVKRRLEQLLDLQIVRWEQVGPIVKRGTASVWMHGEWVNGLAALLKIFPERLADISGIGFPMARWVLKAWKHWDGEQWGIPYYVNVDASPISEGPSMGLSDWTLASLQLLDGHARHLLAEDELTKLDAILEDRIYSRKSPPQGGIPRWLEWLIA
ncbi:MAG: hypothetical protein HKN46_10110, partial [Acidimicrobiia bacterium]|nr:hypothetical protein [Acidimicrobiia bacterium]